MNKAQFDIQKHCGKCKMDLTESHHYDQHGNLRFFGANCKFPEVEFEDE